MTASVCNLGQVIVRLTREQWDEGVKKDRIITPHSNTYGYTLVLYNVLVILSFLKCMTIMPEWFIRFF